MEQQKHGRSFRHRQHNQQEIMNWTKKEHVPEAESVLPSSRKVSGRVAFLSGFMNANRDFICEHYKNDQ